MSQEDINYIEEVLLPYEESRRNSSDNNNNQN